MTTPDQNTFRPAGPSRPPGVLPKNINFLVLGGIAVLVLAASLFSGKRAAKVIEATAPAGPSVNQLKAFQQMLEKQAREAEAAKKQLEAMHLKQEGEKQVPARQSLVGTGNSGALDENRRKRSADAPFASNFVFRASAPEKASADVVSQVVISEKHRDEPESFQNTPTPLVALKESGERLQLKVRDLYRLLEGTSVQTVLANHLDGSFTGPVLCLVSKEVYSTDGSALLIPKGSKFIGTASRVEAQNQVRLAVAFSRLLLPNGYSIQLDKAPGLDSGGETGLKDKVNNHRLRTFGISGAIGLLGGLALFGTQGNPFAAGVANRTGSDATNVLSHFLNAVPTITIREGHSVLVYLPSDLMLPEYRP